MANGHDKNAVIVEISESDENQVGIMIECVDPGQRGKLDFIAETIASALCEDETPKIIQ